MSDFKHINEFRKGSVLRKISEDPTYLSFFFMFDTVDREHSPLFAGPAKEYLAQFVDKHLETNYATNLEAFQKVLLKINTDMPWFWQKITGLELVETYGKMEEPWRGSESPKIEIECLEENVELTAIGLMTLYKRCVYDYERYIEILPKNLRHFRVWIVLSEVRTFQQDIGARDLDQYGSPMPKNNEGKSVNIIPRAKGPETSVTRTAQKFDIPLVQQYSADAKPHVMFELGFCEWQQDSIADMFADASKMPELKKPKISFVWNTARMNAQSFGANIASELDDSAMAITKPNDGLYPNTPFNPLAIAQNAISDKVNGIAGALVNRFNNLKNSLPGFGKNPLGAVYPERLTGPAASLANAGLDKLKSLLLDNVHGASGTLNTLSDVNSALSAGSINGITNLIGNMVKKSSKKPAKGSISPNEVYDSTAVNDASPDGKLNERVYEPAPEEPVTRRIVPGRIHERGIDSSIDNSLNDNVYE
jgi:hypothetical protein